MTGMPHRALLPAGMVDLLPPIAEIEAISTQTLMSLFARNGYERVAPPLVEFEENLMVGGGAATAEQSFRLMDPVSQRMMALRADMTIQISRIASSRLSDLPRPLRLSYAGQVLRVKGSDIRPQRQFAQVGIELIGSKSHLADVEIILMATQGLSSLGIKDISVDLGMPTLVDDICLNRGIEDATTQRKLRAALNQKDRAEIVKLGGNASVVLDLLLSAVGPADNAINSLKDIKLSPKGEHELSHLEAVVSSLKERTNDLSITVDPVEIRGYEYHTGLTFTIFSNGVRGELGRGGRYNSVNSESENLGEEATGVTLFIDTLVGSMPKPKPPKKMFVPQGSNEDLVKKLTLDGWIAVGELDLSQDQEDEAFRLGCTHIIRNGKLENLKTI